jgi:Tol biopolymer transport system component
LIDEEGGNADALAGANQSPGASYYPRYSPNGMWIAHTISASAISTISASDAVIRAVKADNSGQTLDLPLLKAGASSYPTWSVDGTFLSFSSNRPGVQGGWDIWIAPIDSE